MKLATLATLSVVAAVGHVSASPAENVLTPTGVPATSGPPFSFSFDTTAASSVLSALSSLISSESTAITPFTATSQTQPGTTPTSTPGASGSTPTQTSASPTGTATQTSGAGSLGLVWRSGDVVGVGFAVLGVVAALVC